MANRAALLAVGLCGSVMVTVAGCGTLDRSLRSYEATSRSGTVAAKLNELADQANQGLQAARSPGSDVDTKPIADAGCGGMWKTVTGDPLTTSSPYTLKIEINARIGSRSRLLPVLTRFRQQLEEAGWTVAEDESAPPHSKAPAQYRPIRFQPGPEGYRGWVDAAADRDVYSLTVTIIAPCLRHPDEE